MFCEYCQRKISRWKKWRKHHENVCQHHSTHFFCSYKCKEEWSLDMMRNSDKKIITWAVGEFYNKCFFVRNVVSVSTLGSLNSCFAQNLKQIVTLKTKTTRKTEKA